MRRADSPLGPPPFHHPHGVPAQPASSEREELSGTGLVRANGSGAGGGSGDGRGGTEAHVEAAGDGGEVVEEDITRIVEGLLSGSGGTTLPLVRTKLLNLVRLLYEVERAV
ncbi:MAG: hypothetical protein M3220_05280 [Chloroflexota bacterium]|nr:hypothetical protein [Chloroflexota bacterium]